MAKRSSGGRVAGGIAVVVAVLGVLGVIAVGLRALPAASNASPRMVFPGASPTASPSPTPVPTPEPTITSPPPQLLISPANVKINAAGWWSWAMMDTRTGKITGSKNMNGTNWTASLIKSWIAADFLRREATAGRTPSSSRMNQLRIMIRDSDNAAADSLFAAVGKTQSIKRMVTICRLTDSRPSDTGGWSKTNLSARDATRLGKCIADGRGAGARWTPWLLGEMRLVRGTGDFGIRKAFPASVQKTIAIKNGWVDRSAQNEYNVNCLAIGDGWTLAVMTRYPLSRGMTYGANICKNVATQLRTTG